MPPTNSVTFVSTALTYGGAEQQVVALAAGFAERGWETRVVSMVTPDAHVERLEQAGVALHSLDMRPGVPDPRAVVRLAGWLRRWRPDVVHGHMLHANLLTRVTRPLAPTPVLVSTAHNTYEGRRRDDRPGWVERAYRATDRLCDLTTNVSHVAVKRYIDVGAVPRERIRWVPNGIDTGQFRPDPDARTRVRAALGLGDHFTLLAVGRFETQKDHSGMLRAFAEFVHHRPKSVLLLVGQGPLEGAVREEIEALGLGKAVRLLGVRDDVPELMNAADTYVMSSRWEGLPIVLLEASAIGLPIVATTVGGNAEIVEDGVSGFLVPPGRPDELAQVLERLAGLSDGERAGLGTAGRARIQREYGIEHVLDVWNSIYGELLERSGRQPARQGRRGRGNG